MDQKMLLREMQHRMANSLPSVPGLSPLAARGLQLPSFNAASSVDPVDRELIGLAVAAAGIRKWTGQIASTQPRQCLLQLPNLTTS